MIKIINEDFDIVKIAESGQIFRVNRQPDGKYFLQAGDKCLSINGNTLECSENEYKVFWEDYFDLKTDYSAFRNTIPKKDSFMTAASEYGKGIRILRQDPWEMLISFIISQRKNIPAIKSSVEALCRLKGRKIRENIYAFPTPEALASATDEELKACSLGYRVPYIMDTAKKIADGFDLEALHNLPDDELLNKLMEFKGVGIKVANCISLFAYHRIDAFPIDVWIDRTLKKEYPYGFPFELYKGFGGVIQQYMFFYARTEVNNKSDNK